MAHTTVRIAGLQPRDIQVRKAPWPRDEAIVQLGDTVSVQGLPAQLKIVLKLADAQLSSLAASGALETEPF